MEVAAPAGRQHACTALSALGRGHTASNRFVAGRARCCMTTHGRSVIRSCPAQRPRLLRSFSSGDIHLLVHAFIVYVRPVVEYYWANTMMMMTVAHTHTLRRN